MGIRFISKRLSSEIVKLYERLAEDSKKTVNWNISENQLLLDSAAGVSLTINGQKLVALGERIEVTDENGVIKDEQVVHYDQQFKRLLFGDRQLTDKQANDLNKLYALINQDFYAAITLELNNYILKLLADLPSGPMPKTKVVSVEINANEQGQLAIKIKGDINLNYYGTDRQPVQQTIYSVEASYTIGDSHDISLQISEAKNDSNLTRLLQNFQDDYTLAPLMWDIQESYDKLISKEMHYLEKLGSNEKDRLDLVSHARQLSQEIQLQTMQIPYVKAETPFQSIPLQQKIPTSDSTLKQHITTLCESAEKEKKISVKMSRIDIACKTISDTYSGRDVKQNSYSDILNSIRRNLDIQPLRRVKEVFSGQSPKKATTTPSKPVTSAKKTSTSSYSIVSWIKSFIWKDADKTPKPSQNTTVRAKAGDSIPKSNFSV